MKRIVIAVIIALVTYQPVLAQDSTNPVQQAQQDAASAQAAANAASAQAAAAQQAAADAAARAQQAAANAASARSQADLAQLKAIALESQQAAVAAQAAQAQADLAVSEARAASAAASLASAQAQRASAQAQSLQITAMAANARAVSVDAQARAAAIEQQIAIEALNSRAARLTETVSYEREQTALFRLIAGLLCVAVLITAAIALLIYRRLRALSVVVVESPGAPAPSDSRPLESRLPDLVRIINDPAVIARLDEMFEVGA